MARNQLLSNDYDKILIPVYVICEPVIVSKRRQQEDYKFLLQVSEDENFAGFKGMIFNR